MTEQEARAWNAAIDAAARRYRDGIGAIKSLKVRYPVTVEHGKEVKEDGAD